MIIIKFFDPGLRYSRGMKKLIEGIVEFRRTKVPIYRERFADLAHGQSPRFLFFACADSRVITTMIASSEPGDIFLVRNVGNLIPRSSPAGQPSGEVSEGAAIEFALSRFDISDVIVCGHSECGAMLALSEGGKQENLPSLHTWLSYGETALKRLEESCDFCPELPFHNRLSRINLLLQLENLMSYPLVESRVRQGKMRLNAWWFDVAKADVYGYDAETKRFVLIDEKGAEHFINRLEGEP